MRKVTTIAVAFVALAAASIAIADGFSAKSAKRVSATFAATTVASVDTRTCTTSDGKSIAVTKGTYTGTATGDADLTGAAKVQLQAVINTTDNIGAIGGTIKIDTAGDRNTVVHFDAVYDGGQLAGLATGHAGKDTKLLANLSAGFTAAGGLTGGKLGGGTTGGSAVELGPGKCAKTKSEHSEAVGTVSAVSSTSITVAGVTCTVPASLATKVADVKVGDRVAIRCDVVNGVSTLAKLSKRD